MAQINKPNEYFDNKLYTGNGSSQSITGLNFSPAFCWLKVRSTTGDHGIFDTARGTTKFIRPNKTNDEGTSDSISSFDANGFSLGAGWNDNSATFASWNWRGGTTASGSTSGSGTAKTYNSSTSAVSGFSVVKYVGNGTANHQFPHGLGVKPDMVWIKNLDDATTNWQGYNSDLTATKSFKLNSSDAPATTNSVTNDVEPTTTVFNLGSAGDANANDQEHIAYCFASIKGYSKVGQYSGNSSTDGTFLYLGFKPAFIIIKDISSTDPWLIFDNKRSSINVVNHRLFPNTNGSENTSDNACDFLSNGIKFRSSNDGHNGSRTYMYYAVAEQPLVGTNNIPATAR